MSTEMINRESDLTMNGDGYPELHKRIASMRARSANALPGKIITVMSPKGGQGKSLCAKELGYILNSVLVDLDWDGGRVSRLLGYLVARYKNAPLLDALETGQAPRLYRSSRRPDMVPGHPDFEPNQPEPDVMAELLIAWAEEYGAGMVTDTHPGGSPSTLGAAQAADLVVMPVVLGTGELDAVEEALATLSHLPLLLVPNLTPKAIPAVEARRLVDLATRYEVAIANTFIHRHTWLTTRKHRTVVSASVAFGLNSASFTNEMLDLGEEVLRHVAA